MPRALPPEQRREFAVVCHLTESEWDMLNAVAECSRKPPALVLREFAMVDLKRAHETLTRPREASVVTI